MNSTVRWLLLMFRDDYYIRMVSINLLEMNSTVGWFLLILRMISKVGWFLLIFSDD